MNKSLYIIPLLFLISIFFVSAYDISTLKAYYSFEDTNITFLIDTVANQNLNKHAIFGDEWIKTSGLIGDGIKSDKSKGSSLYIGNFTNQLLTNYTINYWFKYDGYTFGISRIILSNQSINTYGAPTETYYAFITLKSVSGYPKNALTTHVSSGIQNVTYFNTTYTPNEWNMITFVHTDGYLKIYVNGVVQTNTNINYTNNKGILWNNTKYLYLDSQNTSIDELSIFSSILDSSDLITLYNNGIGINYNELNNSNNTVLSPVCIDAFTFCTNYGLTQYPHTFGLYYCNYGYDTFCSGGCNNVTNVCDTTGVSECSVLGETRCIDAVNKATCQDSNMDGYLDLKSYTTCAINTYCVESGLHFALCKNVSQSGVHEQYALKVIPYAVSDKNTLYNLNEQQRSLLVNTVLPSHEQKFYDTGVNFTSRICDYKETNIFSTPSQQIINATIFTLSSPTSTNHIVRMSLSPNINSNGSIELKSLSGVQNSKVYYERNATDKSVCIKDNTLTNIYCDYDYTGSDTFKNINLEYTFDMTTHLYTLSIYFSRLNSNIRATYPITFIGGDLYTIIIDSNDTVLNNLSIENIPSFRQFSTVGTSFLSTTLNPNCDILCNGLLSVTGVANPCNVYKLLYGEVALNQLCSISAISQVFTNNCIYTTNGVKKVRTYGNNNGVPDFSVYADYNINLQGTGLTQTQIDDKTPTGKTGDKLTEQEKRMIWALIITFFTAITTAIFIGWASRGSEKAGIVGFLAFCFVVLTGLVTFGIMGWVSVIFAILVGLLDTIFIVVGFKTLFLSTSG